MEKMAKTIGYASLPGYLQPCGKALRELALQACEDMTSESGGDDFVAALVAASELLPAIAKKDKALKEKEALERKEALEKEKALKKEASKKEPEEPTVEAAVEEKEKDE